MRGWLFGIIFAVMAANAAAASEVEPIFATVRQVCDGAANKPPPLFEASRCAPAGIADADPQKREIWVVASVDAPRGYGGGKPLGLFVSAKAASEVYLNGVRLGANGTPAAAPQDETPGRMDSVFAIPHALLRPGANEVVLRMSSHRGLLRLRRPIHVVAVAVYGDPTNWISTRYTLPLITLGALLAGAFYFAASSATGPRRTEPALLAALSLFAAGQLIAEAWRGLDPYLYPAHDWRLLLIVAMSMGFGLTLAAVIIRKFLTQHGVALFSAIFVATAAAIFLAKGFDLKAAAAILIPVLASAVIAAAAAIKKTPQALLYAGVLAAFSATIILFPALFLDALFFLEVAVLILVFFISEAFAFARERKERELESARARDLAAALERAAAKENPPVVRVNAAGSLSIVEAGEIAFCKGAGDYVELNLSDGRVLLHNGALADMERDLPGGFLRVHRSFLVNTEFAKSLTRESSGVGLLTLSTGAEIPVSRRIMPRVRSALR
jgi:DNA-binding LytR/AlgR family response regulator